MKYLPTGWPAQLLKSIVASDRRHAVIASCHPPLFHAQERPSRKGPSGRRGYEGDLCEGNEVVTPCHPPGAVGCDQLADHAHGRAAREARKVNRRLGVPCTPAAPVAPDRTHECARTRTQRRTHTRTQARSRARAHTHTLRTCPHVRALGTVVTPTARLAFRDSRPCPVSQSGTVSHGGTISHGGTVSRRGSARTGALEHAAGPGSQREDVARPVEVLRDSL